MSVRGEDAEEEEVADVLPSIVGERWQVLYDKPLGSGHFGEVFEGRDMLDRRKTVAVKLSKTRISSREISALQALDGKGAPAFFYYGVCEGNYHVLVMQKLGSSLYSVIEKRSNDRRRKWVLTKTEARQVGMQCLDLLENLHSTGFVHGDVKPANFVCTRGSTLSSLKLVDFGLSRQYRSDDETHIEYWQHLTHFAGSLRYASIHAHLGRRLTRRDDLESLAYMLLYLMLGTLPWQGFRGADKGKLICLSKGAIPLDQLCADVPSGLMHYLACVRKLKFDEDPNYAYLRDCLDFGRVDFSESPCGDSDATAVAALGATGGTEAAGAALDDCKVGQKRGPPADNSAVQPQLKKHRVILPPSRKVHQWIVISSQTEQKFPQRMLTSTNIDALLRKVNTMCESEIGSNGQPWRVQTLCHAEKTFRAVLNCAEHGVQSQKLFRAGSDAEFMDFVQQLSSSGYCVSHVLGTPNGWVVCASIYTVDTYEHQRFGLAETFPSKWVEECWEDMYYITAIGSTPTKWLVVMSCGSSSVIDEQIVELSFSYPSEAIRARWRDGYAITAAGCTGEQSAYVMSRCVDERDIVQRCTRTSHNPSLKLRVESRQDFSIDAVTFGRVE